MIEDQFVQNNRIVRSGSTLYCKRANIKELIMSYNEMRTIEK